MNNPKNHTKTANISNLSDEKLFEYYKNSNNSEYIGQLFTRYTHLVYGACLKYMKNTEAAEESVMEIFEKILMNAHKYNIEFFKSWLFIVTKNHCFQKLKQKNRFTDINNTEISLEFMEYQPEVYLNEEKSLEQEKTKKLRPALEKLKSEQKQCVELFYLDGKSYKEIVDETGFSLKNVKSYIQNGKRNLKKILSTLKMLFL